MLITKNGVKIDSAKVITIKQWLELLNIHDIRCFLRFINFYRRFIKGFLKIAQSLVYLIKKNIPFNTTKKVKRAFNEFRNIFIINTVIAYFDSNKKTIVKIDILDYISGGVFSQYNDKGILRKVAYFLLNIYQPNVITRFTIKN